MERQSLNNHVRDAFEKQYYSMLFTLVNDRIHYPNPGIVKRLKIMIRSGKFTQKAIGEKCDISGTKLSQYMNNNGRRKGWAIIDEILSKFLDKYERKIKCDKIKPIVNIPTPNIVNEIIENTQPIPARIITRSISKRIRSESTTQSVEPLTPLTPFHWDIYTNCVDDAPWPDDLMCFAKYDV